MEIRPASFFIDITTKALTSQTPESEKALADIQGLIQDAAEHASWSINWAPPSNLDPTDRVRVVRALEAAGYQVYLSLPGSSQYTISWNKY